MGTLYIFGSGFLCNLGYPLGSEMYDRFKTFAEKISCQPHLNEENPPLKYNEIFHRISLLYNEWLEKELIYKGFNSFMNHIAESRESLLRRGVSKEVVKKYLGIPYIMHDYFWHVNNNPFSIDIIQESESAKIQKKRLEILNLRYKLKKFVLHILQDGDVVINFNYDIEIEKILMQFSKKWIYGYDSGCISIIKPHGSINWLKGDKKDKIRYEDKYNAIEKTIEDFGYKEIYSDIWDVGYVDYLRRKDGWERQIMPVTIPPVDEIENLKVNEYESVFKHIARQIEMISCIDKVVSVGFSFGSDDRLAVETIKKIINKFGKSMVRVGTDNVVTFEGINIPFEYKKKDSAEWLEEYMRQS